ncbi:MAG: CHAT domain-containing protein, partial [Chloroflexi bacterium SZAS-1]|nr:CHAT domain-containing protein [Chloroflexi bacterium SZAS-1]
MTTDQPLDLVITLSAAPADAAPDTVALFTLTYGALGPTPPAPLASPLSDAERAELRWYLEEYWQWPYEGFRQRAARVEESLAAIGRRLYAALTSSVAAVRVVDAWRALAERDRRISIVSGVPAALSLPWELLHDEQGFLLLRARHPVSLVRRLPQQEGVPEPAALVLPLRVLLVTARPDDAGFVDPRGIARELLDEVERGDQASGAPPIAVEFLRPPTLPALTERLANTALPPIHILHFDGHGVFAAATPAADGLVLGEAGGRGMLAFETADGLLDLVPADRLAEVLNGSGVRLAMLTACQSAMTGGDDPFSSVAGRLIRGGVDAVVAMSASVLVASAARYVEAFYRKVAAGQPVPAAHERARQALHADPRRHTHRRYADAPGEAVQLRDWWLPHFYQQRALDFQPAAAGTTGKKQVAARGQAASVAPALPAEIAAQVRLPDPPRYGFSGRAAELLRAERWLSAGKLVAVLGFGGVGKTAFAGELAAWLTRTGMYRHALFVTFEGGGDASSLLSTLGHALGVYRSGYDPANLAGCIKALRPALARSRTLLIADNLESILDEGEAALPVGERTRLWDALLALRDAGVGVLLTSRSAAFGDARLEPGRGAAQLPLSGLHPEDAYALASNLLRDLDIPAARAPYAALRDL